MVQIRRAVMDLNQKGPRPTMPSGAVAQLVGGRWMVPTNSLFATEPWEPFSGIFPASGSMRNGRLFAHPTSAPPNYEPESSSSESTWSTPTCRDKETLAKVTRGANASAGGTPLLVQVQRWPTPTAGDAKGAGSRNLEGSEAHAGVSLTDAVRFGNSTTPRNWATPLPSDVTGGQGAIERGTRGHSLHTAATMFPTPQARDHKGVDLSSRHVGASLPHFLQTGERIHGEAGPPAPESPSTPGSRPASSRPLVLNPRWVLTLMGFPATYLDGVAPPSKRSATRSSRKSAPSSPAVSANSPVVS